MVREAQTDKIIVLGVDAMDPRLTRKYVDLGYMPSVKQYLERGSARHDLVLLGGHPTVTPPMWTTLSCGCYANVHGITGFFRQSPKSLDTICYNLNSRLCEAEPLWNVLAEAGKKTLVWHWPGSSWPPTSDSENLMVIDGTNPGSVGAAVCQVEKDFLVVASQTITEVTFKEKDATEAMAPCVVEDLDLDAVERTPRLARMGETVGMDSVSLVDSNDEEGSGDFRHLILDENQMTTSITEQAIDKVE